jgi:competence protein ComEC
MYIYNPLYLKDISFQLSFAAAWGMVVITPRLEKQKWLCLLPQGIKTAAAVSLGAQIAVLPILIGAFHKVSLAGLFANVFILFVFGAVLQLGLLGCAAIWVPGLHLIFFQAAFWLLQGTDIILALAASLPFAYFWVLNPGPIFWGLWYLGIAVLLMGKDRVRFIGKVQLRKAHKGIRQLKAVFPKSLNKSAIVIIFAVLLTLFICLIWPRSEITVTFLDVGQGDCIVIDTRKERLMVDTGPRTDTMDAGEKIVVPYLMERGIGSLDMLLITHEDRDHAGGAGYLLANIPVRKVAVPGTGAGGELENWRESIPAKILNDRQKMIWLSAGDSLAFSSGLSITVLAPADVSKETGSNSRSLVLLMECLGQKILLTGDMDKEEMNEIADRGQPWDADFLKVPHHGSRGSLDPSWFDRTAPSAVFISVGANSFGQPAPEVLDYWQGRGIPVYRTDIQGTIRLTINKKGGRIVALR